VLARPWRPCSSQPRLVDQGRTSGNGPPGLKLKTLVCMNSMDWSEGNSNPRPLGEIHRHSSSNARAPVRSCDAIIEPAFHQPLGADVGRFLVGARASAERPRNLGAARAAGSAGDGWLIAIASIVRSSYRRAEGPRHRKCAGGNRRDRRCGPPLGGVTINSRRLRSSGEMPLAAIG
jgi:hypothetical protein